MPGRERIDLEKAAALRMSGASWKFVQLRVRRKSGQCFDILALARTVRKFMKEHGYKPPSQEDRDAD